MDRLIKYNYEIHYWPCKTNIEGIAEEISHLPAKYRQHATAVDLEKMILTVTFFHSWLSIFFTQLSAISKLSYYTY